MQQRLSKLVYERGMAMAQLFNKLAMAIAALARPWRGILKQDFVVKTTRKGKCAPFFVPAADRHSRSAQAAAHAAAAFHRGQRHCAAID